MGNHGKKHVRAPHIHIPQVHNLSKTWQRHMVILTIHVQKQFYKTNSTLQILCCHPPIGYLLKSCTDTRHYTLIDTNTTSDTPQDNTIPPCIFNCMCSQHKTHMPDTITSQHPMHTRWCHHPYEAVNPNTEPHHTTHRIHNHRSWRVFRPSHQDGKKIPLVVITTWFRGAIHKSNIGALESFHILKALIKIFYKV